MHELEQFFQAILPEEGWKCVVHIVGQDRKQYFWRTFADLAESVRSLDTRGNVYHGCASYTGELRKTARAVAEGWRATRHREKQDVLWLRSFWLEFDTGIDSDGQPRSKYPEPYDAAEAVLGFCQKLSLPGPLFVGSGNGLHVYWPLAEAIDRPTWERYASGLKLACDNLGLDAGRERTADCSSILRPPGTHWRKDDVRLVQAGPIPAASKLGAFGALLDFTSKPSAVPVAGAGRLRNDSSLAGKILSNKIKDVIDYEQLADNCAQIGALRAEPGKTPEPIWHATMVLLAHCHNGKEAAHAWSDPAWHPKIDEYLERGAERTGPTTCKHFRDIRPEVCKGCPYDVSTPLSTLHVKQPAAGNNRGSDSLKPARAKSGSPFSLSGGKLVFAKENISGEPSLVKVSNFEVRLAHVQYGEIRTADRFYHFRHWLPHHGWLDAEVAAADPNMLLTLQGAGMNIHEGDLFRKWIKEQVDMYNEEREQQIQYEQYGWKSETSFLYGGRLYQPEATIEVPGSTELKFRNQWLQPKKGGSLAGWKDAADRLFGAGSEGQSFAVLAAFACPIMRFANDSEGGAIVSLVTRATGTGKSTALAGTYSVYASDRRALSLTSTDTGNSKGVAMATIGNLPIIHDEFSGDPEVTKNFVKLFTEGRDKARLDRDGQMRHTVGTWQTLLFTASNTSLVDIIGALAGSDALAYRVLEFPVSSAGDFSPAEADRLRKQLELNAGWAGHVFIEYIVRPDVLAMVRQMVQACMEDIYAYGGGKVFGREHRFWVRTLACVAVAAKVVEHLELVAFSPKRIIDWAIDYFAAKEGPLRTSSADWLATFINEHTNEMLVVPRAWSPDDNKKKMSDIVPPRIPTRLTMRRENDTGAYLIDWPTLKRWLVKHEVSPNDFVIDLMSSKIVKGIRNRVLAAGTNLGGGQVRCLEVDGAHPSFSGMVREVESTNVKAVGN